MDGVTILQPTTWAAMAANVWSWSPGNGNNYFGLFRSWGLGVHRITATMGGDVILPGIPMLGHAGEAYGLISDLYLDPVTGFGLVFLTNGYTPGNNYALGINSAWYRVEEEVYAALGTHAYPGCLSTGYNVEASAGTLLPRERQVEWTGDRPVLLEVLDTTGRLLERATLRPHMLWGPHHSGLLMLRAVDAQGRVHFLKLP